MDLRREGCGALLFAWYSVSGVTERRIGHAKAGADVLAEQFDCSAIGDWVGLREVSHRFDQDFLTVYVARIGGALALFRERSGGTGIVKTLAILARFSSVLRLLCSI